MANVINKSKLANLFFIISIILRFTNETTSNISFLVLVILCFFGIREIILSLLFTWLFSSLNSGIAPPLSYAVILRYLVILAAFISSFNHLKFQSLILNKNLYLASLIFFLFILFHSLLISKVPEISILRSISWLLLFTLLINCWSNISEKNFRKLIKDIFIVFTAITLLSLLLVKSKIGYLKNDDGFQGILNHPQLFGIVTSLFGIFILMRFPEKIFSSLFYFMTTIIIVALLILSESRTGIFALFGSYIISIFSNSFYNKKSERYNSAFLLMIVFAPVLIFFSIYSLFIINTVFELEILDNILSKSGRSDNVETFLSTYSESRGALILDSYNNIVKNFWTGIGFGVASDYESMKIYRETLFNIPYSAPIEKGMFYIALYEELGFIGYIVFLFFLSVCLLSMMLSGLRSFPLLIIILSFNIAESSFFSTGGVGGLLILFFTLSITRKSYIKQDY